MKYTNLDINKISEVKSMKVNLNDSMAQIDIENSDNNDNSLACNLYIAEGEKFYTFKCRVNKIDILGSRKTTDVTPNALTIDLEGSPFYSKMMVNFGAKGVETIINNKSYNVESMYLVPAKYDLNEKSNIIRQEFVDKANNIIEAIANTSFVDKKEISKIFKRKSTTSKSRRKKSDE